MTVYSRLALIIGMTAACAVPALGATATAAAEGRRQPVLRHVPQRAAEDRRACRSKALDVDHVAADAATWEKVVRKLRLRRHAAARRAPSGRGDLREPDRRGSKASSTRAALAHPNPGRPVLHRLNRAEYANAIRDLLGLNVDVAALLPPDDAAYGFDNVADALGSSPALLQAYSRRRAEDQRGGRRRSARRRQSRHVLRPAGSLAGPAPRRAAARHARRACRDRTRFRSTASTTFSCGCGGPT